MSSFTSVESLFRDIEMKVEDTLRTDVGNYTKDKLTESKQTEVYDILIPEYYIRTYEFLNSSTLKYESSSNNFKKVISVFSDTRIKSMPSRHRSWADNSNQNKMIPIWLEYGNGLYGGSYYFQKFVRAMNDNIKKQMIIGLRKRNIEAY